MITKDDSKCFERRKNAHDYNFFDLSKYEFSLFRKSLISDWDCLIDLGGLVEKRVEKYDSIYILLPNGGEDCGFSRGCESEMEVIREVLKLSGGSRNEKYSFLRINDFVQSIEFDDFINDDSFTEVVFSPPSQLRLIGGFQKCTSLRRIEIPSSVEIIERSGFLRCTSLTEIICSSNSRLRVIYGFQECTSFRQIEIPSSVEVIGTKGFCHCTSIRVVIIHSGCRMRRNEGLQQLHPVIVYENEVEDMKSYRRHIHLGIGKRQSSIRGS
jgi:hypothetical protein